MKLPVEKIKIISDYRIGVRDLTELANSINQRGLLQPMLLTPIPDKDEYEIAAGRSRYRAMVELLGFTELEEGVHFIIRQDVDPLVAQLEENVKRKDFEPLEIANLINTIHTQKQAEHGKAVPGKSRGWGAGDTGKLISMSSSSVSQYLKLWNNRDIVEDGETMAASLEKIRTKRAAKMINRVRSAIAKKVQKKIEKQQDKLYATCIQNFKCMDAVEYCRSLERVSHVITDPPYGINYDSITSGDGDYGNYEDRVDDYWQLMKQLVPEFSRLVENGFIVIWCATSNAEPLKDLMKDAGIKCAAVPLLWVKTGSPGFTAHPEKILGNVYEVAVYGWKGDPELGMKGHKNVFKVPTIKKNRVHVAQKPDELMEKVIRTFTKKGEGILDCFGGSGSTLRACIKTKRMYFGCEKDEDFYNSAIKLTNDILD